MLSTKFKGAAQIKLSLQILFKPLCLVGCAIRRVINLWTVQLLYIICQNCVAINDLLIRSNYEVL